MWCLLENLELGWVGLVVIVCVVVDVLFDVARGLFFSAYVSIIDRSPIDAVSITYALFKLPCLFTPYYGQL